MSIMIKMNIKCIICGGHKFIETGQYIMCKECEAMYDKS